MRKIDSIFESINNLIIGAKKIKNQIRYIVHKHEAEKSGLHFDLRIQYPDQNKAISFAIPNASFPKPGDKLLAIKTNDHAMWWLDVSEDFDISDGYGKGHLSTVQSGKLDIIKWEPNQISFFVVGNKMNGRYHLIKIKNKENNKQDTYLFIKSKPENN